MRRYIVLVAMILSAIGCSKSEVDASQPGGGGLLEGVEVRLDLEVSVMQNPGTVSEGSPMMKSMESRVVASEHVGGMFVELVESPETEQIPLSKTAFAPDETTIQNLWVFVYGTSGNDAILMFRKYYATPPADGSIKMLMSIDQRVVLIANTFNPDLGDDSDLQLGSTYQMLLDKTAGVSSEQEVITDDGKSLMLSGTAVYQGIGSTLDVKMLRNVTKVNFEIILGTGDMELSPLYQWKIQMCDLPDKSYYLPPTDGDASMLFPTTVTSFSYPEEVIMPTTTQSALNSWYIPMNRRGTKPGTTPFLRKTNAPQGSTYVKIVGKHSYAMHTYTIHLGKDFTEDYNLRPNCLYTYRVTLYDSGGVDADSRVEGGDVGLYVGMFGGTLEGDIDNGWAFTKALYIDEVKNLTDPEFSWLSNGIKVPTNSLIQGKANTLLLKDPSYPAGNYCFTKNQNWESITQESDGYYAWYLPASNQLLCIWVMWDSYPEYPYNTNGDYWSSSQEGNYTHALDFKDGCYDSDYDDSKNYVRCVRE